MLANVEDDVQVPRGTTPRADLPFSGEPNLLTSVHSRRDLDRQLLPVFHPAPAAALLARRADDLSLALTGVAHDDVDELAEDRLLDAPQLSAAVAAGAG